MYIVQYILFLVHISHTPHHILHPTLLPTKPLLPTNPLPDPTGPRPPPPHTPPPPRFFVHFHNYFNYSFTSTLTPTPSLPFICIFTITSIICSHPPGPLNSSSTSRLNPYTPDFLHFYNNFIFRSHPGENMFQYKYYCSLFRIACAGRFSSQVLLQQVSWMLLIFHCF